jgi:hypothetical protein
VTEIKIYRRKREKKREIDRERERKKKDSVWLLESEKEI